jgi:tRNA (adenine57-N1/adenine58-N1)-methyltransferase
MKALDESSGKSMTDRGNSRWFEGSHARTAYGDRVLLLTSDQKRYLITLSPPNSLHTHQGIYHHADLVDLPLGSIVKSHQGHESLIMEPSLADLIQHIKRATQIIYPKDAAYLVHRMNLRAGSRVVEAGTGSGGLTIALAWAVAPTGRVYTYEARQENFQQARRNLERVDLLSHVTMYQRSIRDGFEETDADALFLDVRHPWDFLPQVQNALHTGGFFASLVPTTNQVSQLLEALEANAFADIGVEELLLRRYKPVPERLRPEDEMVAHTGYLVFARSIAERLDPDRWQTKERRRYRARRNAQSEMAERERIQAEENAASGRKYPPMPLP